MKLNVACFAFIHLECMSESEVELDCEESQSRRRRRRKRGAKKKSGFSIFSDQLISSNGPVSSPASSFVSERKMSSLELENLEDSMSTALADSPPGMSQITPGSVVSSQSMWELGSYDEEVVPDSTQSRPIIRSPMMLLATTEDRGNKVDEIVAGIESVLGSIQSVAGSSFSRLCVPSSDRRLCVPSRSNSDGLFEVFEKVKQSVSNSVDEILSKMNPPEKFGQVLNGLDREVEMTVPVLNRRQKRSILFGSKG